MWFYNQKITKKQRQRKKACNTSNYPELNFNCIWHKIFFISSFEECRLIYCDDNLGCRVGQDVDFCKLENMRRHKVDTSPKSWNSAGLLRCQKYSLWWWLWCHLSDVLVTRPLHSQIEKYIIYCSSLTDFPVLVLAV